MPTENEIRLAIMNFLKQRNAVGDHENFTTTDVDLGELSSARGWDSRRVGEVAFLLEQEGYIATTKELGVVPPNSWLTQKGRAFLDPNNPFHQEFRQPRNESINVGGNFYGAAATGGGFAQASVTIQAHQFLENLKEAAEKLPGVPDEERGKLTKLIDGLLKHPLAVPIFQWSLEKTLGG